MTWEEIKQRKEDSIRESTNNPMVKNPNPYDKNGKTYKSFTDYLNSDEYKEYLEIQEEALDSDLVFQGIDWDNFNQRLAEAKEGNETKGLEEVLGLTIARHNRGVNPSAFALDCPLRGELQEQRTHPDFLCR